MSIASKITNLASRKTYLVIILPNSYQKLTKSKIRSSWCRFEHCSKPLISALGHYLIWSLFASIQMKNWPKSKLGQVGVGSNIAQNHSCSPLESHIWPLFVPIHLTNWPKLKSGWSRFEHFSKSLFKPLRSHIWSLFAPIHMKKLQNQN